ncbi:MAG: transposase [Chloroflexi bacterium]|nr:transposase [Chloroflexota bacterium]
MPDHLHLVLSVQRKTSLGRVLQLIKGRFAWRYNRDRRRSGKVWQDRYHEKALRSEAELHRAMEYVENNPVTGGLADRPEYYLWSSASGARGQAKSLTPQENGRVPGGSLPAYSRRRSVILLSDEDHGGAKGIPGPVRAR